ncbi:MAG: hypothetical protein FWG31_05045 [Oscillospiraceae bacterium]|nr:hypothetical protein [Oscillospiraceae bacterium]
MQYTYHCQHQAESFANEIIPVPEDYPLKAGLPEDFRGHFAKLCEMAKNIYLDMAKRPEAYGLTLLDVSDKDHNRARDSYRAIHRLGDTLNALFLNGEVQNHCLTADAARFKAAAKKIPKYKMILSRLRDFGFIISETLTAEYPDHPIIIDVIKIYCDEMRKIMTGRREQGVKERKNDETLIRLAAEQFHHHFYRFDYKVTADLSKIPMLTWVNDEAAYQGYDGRLKRFNEAFFLESLKYKDLLFNGDYTYRSKRIARITDAGYKALGERDVCLSLKLSEPDKYMDSIRATPDSIRELFQRNYCNHCDFQGATGEYCKFRLKWTFGGTPYEGCAYQCFNFYDFDIALVPDYWRLLELEYGLIKTEMRGK